GRSVKCHNWKAQVPRSSSAGPRAMVDPAPLFASRGPATQPGTDFRLARDERLDRLEVLEHRRALVVALAVVEHSSEQLLARCGGQSPPQAFAAAPRLPNELARPFQKARRHTFVQSP